MNAKRDEDLFPLPPAPPPPPPPPPPYFPFHHGIRIRLARTRGLAAASPIPPPWSP